MYAWIRKSIKYLKKAADENNDHVDEDVSRLANFVDIGNRLDKSGEKKHVNPDVTIVLAKVYHKIMMTLSWIKLEIYSEIALSVVAEWNKVLIPVPWPNMV